jgi:DNA-binding MarR family transcriptional regulator
MQRLSPTNDLEATPEACAGELLDALPPVMRFVRRHMRSHRGKGLSVPQFRSLVMLRSLQAANLSALADQLGASHPTTSRIVSGLVRQGLVQRRQSDCDRRQVELCLTTRGAAVMETARRATREQLAKEIAALDRPTRDAVLHAMVALQSLFQRSRPAGSCATPDVQGARSVGPARKGRGGMAPGRPRSTR